MKQILDKYIDTFKVKKVKIVNKIDEVFTVLVDDLFYIGADGKILMMKQLAKWIQMP